MTLFPSPTHRCLLPSFPFHVWWKSFFLVELWGETLVCVIVDMKCLLLFFFLFDWVIPCICYEGWYLSSVQLGPFLHVYHKDRKMQLRRGTPPYNILGSSGNFTNKDAFSWSVWSSVTQAPSLREGKCSALHLQSEQTIARTKTKLCKHTKQLCCERSETLAMMH